jgi:hypothetical protein
VGGGCQRQRFGMVPRFVQIRPRRERRGARVGQPVATSVMLQPSEQCAVPVMQLELQVGLGCPGPSPQTLGLVARKNGDFRDQYARARGAGRQILSGDH